ncbi:uncharacterized protein LOC131171249 [Hevea brasiliensis]|uniref:uncharacterized protein LOC131171249 n=1 Tax=Hevea brasiliensis TaxID=3981 RepID=UPI0025D2AAAA|nr:uncharacterized protein LOC131171249 [Hevea brasiliensis]
MKSEFEMSIMGELKFFFGLQIKQAKDNIFINQAKYTKELIKRFGMLNSKPSRTPMSTNTKLDKDVKGKPVDEKLYRGMIGSFLYLTASRQDIMFSVCGIVEMYPLIYVPTRMQTLLEASLIGRVPQVICQDSVDALNRLLDGFTSSMQMKLVNLYCSFLGSL